MPASFSISIPRNIFILEHFNIILSKMPAAQCVCMYFVYMATVATFTVVEHCDENHFHLDQIENIR